MQKINTLALVHLYTTRTTALLAGVCSVAVFLYAIFLLVAVAHTASRTTAQRTISDITAHVADLQTRYLAETKNLTLARAVELGFTSPTVVSTVYESNAQHGLSLNMSASNVH